MTTKSAVMLEAHRLFKDMRRFDQSYPFGRAIAWASHNARARRSNVVAQMNEIRAAIESLTFDPSTKKYGSKK